VRVTVVIFVAVVVELALGPKLEPPALIGRSLEDRVIERRDQVGARKTVMLEEGYPVAVH
jgi:hypothetical protein